jgi:hypothetical protein
VSNGGELKSPAAEALRDAGYLPLPRWWVTQEQLDLIAYMIKDNAPEISRIRAEARQRAFATATLTFEEQIELAWNSRKEG